jgi:hypothetical protein
MSEIAPKKIARTKAEIIVQMTKEAKQIERRTGAKACVVICFFEEGSEAGKNITVQDAGRFPMPPDEFYGLMVRAHEQGLLNTKPKSKIIKPH